MSITFRRSNYHENAKNESYRPWTDAEAFDHILQVQLPNTALLKELDSWCSPGKKGIFLPIKRLQLPPDVSNQSTYLLVYRLSSHCDAMFNQMRNEMVPFKVSMYINMLPATRAYIKKNVDVFKVPRPISNPAHVRRFIDRALGRNSNSVQSGGPNKSTSNPVDPSSQSSAESSSTISKVNTSPDLLTTEKKSSLVDISPTISGQWNSSPVLSEVSPSLSNHTSPLSIPIFKIPPSSDLIPPSSDLIPPSSDVIPPSSDVIPPSSDVIPPSSDLIPPSSDLIPPGSDEISPSVAQLESPLPTTTIKVQEVSGIARHDLLSSDSSNEPSLTSCKLQQEFLNILPDQSTFEKTTSLDEISSSVSEHKLSDFQRNSDSIPSKIAPSVPILKIPQGPDKEPSDLHEISEISVTILACQHEGVADIHLTQSNLSTSSSTVH